MWKGLLYTIGWVNQEENTNKLPEYTSIKGFSDIAEQEMCGDCGWSTPEMQALRGGRLNRQKEGGGRIMV